MIQTTTRAMLFALALCHGTTASAQEASADAAGASFLSKAGISGRGSIAFFGRTQTWVRVQ